MSRDSRHLAYYLAGASEQDDDLYVMINAEPQDVAFTIHQGQAKDWRRVVDTSRKNPDDIREAGKEAAIRSNKYLVKERSIVVLMRRACSENTISTKRNVL